MFKMADTNIHTVHTNTTSIMMIRIKINDMFIETFANKTKTNFKTKPTFTNTSGNFKIQTTSVNFINMNKFIKTEPNKLFKTQTTKTTS